MFGHRLSLACTREACRIVLYGQGAAQQYRDLIAFVVLEHSVEWRAELREGEIDNLLNYLLRYARIVTLYASSQPSSGVIQVPTKSLRSMSRPGPN